jgi:hypothetical protein
MRDHHLRRIREVLFLFSLSLAPLSAQDGPESFITEEAPAELMSLNLGDTDVSLFVSGFWKSTLSANWGMALTPLGLTAASGDSPLLFTQETDLTLSLWILEHWFVETNFQDDYHLNTYRAGYQGSPGEAVQYVGVGNTGLDFPIFPYLDLGGDSPSSFGVYGRFGGGPFQIHGLFRYDAAVREERTFVGNRERTYSHVSVDNPLRGLSFVLPDENLPDVPVVYFEDPSGGIRGSDSRRWRRAGPGEYAASARYGIVELSLNPAGRVAVFYPGSYSLGSYGGSRYFLAETQRFFDGLDLTAFPQSGQDDPSLLGTANNMPGTVFLDGVNALVIYEKGTFSPFERQSRYRAPTSNSAGASLVRNSTGKTIGEYELYPAESISVSPTAELAGPSETSRDIYEIRRTGTASGRDLRSPESRWPLAKQYPAIYLPGNKGFSEDISIQFTNYGATGAYSLGTDVIPGSVQVYRGGLMDSGFAFDASSGLVSLENPAGFNELIRISYLKRNENRENGSLAAGIGAVYDPGGPFSSGLALGLRWNTAAEAYSEEGKTNPGMAGLGAYTAWNYEKLNARLTLGLRFEQSDTAGLYRVFGMEGSRTILSMPPSDSFISGIPADPGGSPPPFSGLSPDTRASLVYRNYRQTDLFGSVTLMSIDWDGAVIVSGQSGPYPVMDTNLSREVLLAAEFSLENGKTWTGFQSPLGMNGEILERAGEASIPYRFYGFEPGRNFRVLVQFGALADEDENGENPSLTVTKEIYPANSRILGVGRIAALRFSDEDRVKLQGARYMRFIIIQDDASAVQGRLLISPPVVEGASFRPILVSGQDVQTAPDSGIKSVTAVETVEKTVPRLSEQYGDRIGKLHPDNAYQRILEVSWKNIETGEAPGTDGRSGVIPLFNYRVLSFFFKAPEAIPGDSQGETVLKKSRLRFLIGRGPLSLNSAADRALDAEIPLADFKPGEWSKIDIRYSGGGTGVSVNGRSLPDAKVSYRSGVSGQGDPAAGSSGRTVSGDSGAKPGYAAIFLLPGEFSQQALPDGSFSIDEICLEDAAPAYSLNGGGSVEWKHPGALVSMGDTPVLADLTLGTALETGIRGDPLSPDTERYAGAVSRSSAEMSLFGARLRGNVSFSLLSDGNYWSAGHGVSRSWGPFSIEESFAAAPADETMSHGLDMRLTGPVRSRIAGDTRYENRRLERKWDAGLGVDGGKRIPLGFSVAADAKWTHNTGDPLEYLENYGEAWVQSWRPLIPDLGEDAQMRNIHGLFTAPLKTTPVGVELSVDGLSDFSEINSTTRSETLGRADISFGSGSYRGLLRGERSFRRSLFYTGSNALDDGFRYYESIHDSLPLWYSLPVYSLFDPYLADTLEEALKNAPAAGITEYGRFREAMTALLQLPNQYGWRAFLIPNTVETRLSRDLEQKLDTALDVFTIGSSLRFSAVNTFGAFGVLPIFTFYQSDELSHNLETTIAIPKNDELSWRVQDEAMLKFYGFRGAELGFTKTLTLGSSGWTESLILDWTVPTQKSLLGALYDRFSAAARGRDTWPVLSELASTEYERLRKETLELVINSTQDSARKETLTSRIIIGHESIIRILGRLYLSAFAKLNCSQDHTNEIFTFIGTIGFTLNVMF